MQSYEEILDLDILMKLARRLKRMYILCVPTVPATSVARDLAIALGPF